MRIDDVLQRIQGEFLEMPGLRLTSAQAGVACEDFNDVMRCLEHLVDAKFLSQTRDGAFVRMEGSHPTVIARSGRGQKVAVA